MVPRTFLGGHRRPVLIGLAVLAVVSAVALNQINRQISQRYLAQARAAHYRLDQGVSVPNYAEALTLYAPVRGRDLDRADLLFLVEASQALGDERAVGRYEQQLARRFGTTAAEQLRQVRVAAAAAPADAAIEQYRSFLVAHPTDPSGYLELASYYERHNNLSAAYTVLSEPKQPDPALQLILALNLGDLARRHGDTSRSRTAYQAVLALDPTNATALRALGISSAARATGGGQ